MLSFHLGMMSGAPMGVVPPPVNSVAPVISGTATEDETLSSTTGTWSNSPTFAYQWKRGATNVGTNASTYTLVAADVGSNMTCVVTATNGSGSANATSNSLGPVASAPAAAAWNPSDKSAEVTLSNSDRTATGDVAAGIHAVRGVTGRSTGKRHFEIVLDTQSGSRPVIGICTAAFSLTANPFGAGTAMIYGGASSTVYVNGTNTGTALATATGNTIAVEYDADADQIWFQKLGDSRKGPFSTTGLGSGTMHPFASFFGDPASVCTINTGQAAFAITPTSGFSAWK